jgi:chromosome partitioning protein
MGVFNKLFKNKKDISNSNADNSLNENIPNNISDNSNNNKAGKNYNNINYFDKNIKTESKNYADNANMINSKINSDDKNYFKKSDILLNKIIAIANQKGGVGKSTTAVNLTSYLGYFGYKTLIIDIDPQSNSTSGLGISYDSEKSSIYNVIIGGEEVEKVKVKTDFSNLEIIPSSIQLAGAEVELVTSMKREYKLKEAIDKVKNDYDYIIIDCPPALGLLTINALSAADEVIIPIQCEYYALEGLGQLLNTIRLVKNNLNSELEIAGALMTMYDPRIKLADQVIAEVKKYFSNKIYNTIIPRNVRLSEAPSYGKPILHYDPECKGAQAYKSFAKEVIENGTKRTG